jgi:hypothetical protein
MGRLTGVETRRVPIGWSARAYALPSSLGTVRNVTHGLTRASNDPASQDTDLLYLELDHISSCKISPISKAIRAPDRDSMKLYPLFHDLVRPVLGGMAPALRLIASVGSPAFLEQHPRRGRRTVVPPAVTSHGLHVARVSGICAGRDPRLVLPRISSAEGTDGRGHAHSGQRVVRRAAPARGRNPGNGDVTVSPEGNRPGHVGGGTWGRRRRSRKGNFGPGGTCPSRRIMRRMVPAGIRRRDQREARPTRQTASAEILPSHTSIMVSHAMPLAICSSTSSTERKFAWWHGWTVVIASPTGSAGRRKLSVPRGRRSASPVHALRKRRGFAASPARRCRSHGGRRPA